MIYGLNKLPAYLTQLTKENINWMAIIAHVIYMLFPVGPKEWLLKKYIKNRPKRRIDIWNAMSNLILVVFIRAFYER